MEIEETFGFSNEDTCLAPDEQILYVPINDESEIISQLDDPLLRQDNDISEDDGKQEIYVTVEPTATAIVDSPIVIEDCNESREILSSEEQQTVYVVEESVPQTQEVTNINRESNENRNQVITDRPNTETQMLYLTVDQSSENETISKANETSNASHDQAVMYVTINHSTEVVDHSKSTQVNSKTNDTNTQPEQNSTVNNIQIDNQMNLVQNRLVISADDIVTNRNHNDIVYQICDDSTLTITSMPKMVGTAKQYYEEVISAQDNVVEVSGNAETTEEGYVAESQETVIYQVLEVPGMYI